MRYILPGVEIRMGLPEFKEVEEFFAAKSAAGGANGGHHGTDIGEQAKTAERSLMRDRTRSIEARQRLRESALEAVKAGDKRAVIDYRVSLVRHIEAMTVMFRRTERVIEAQAKEIEAIGASMTGGDAAQRRYGRKITERMAKAARGEITYRREYLGFLRDDLLKIVDDHMRAEAAKPVSFDDAVEDAFERYPTVIEYLGR